MKPETSEILIKAAPSNEKGEVIIRDIKTRGAIYTRPEVVNLILDLAGYTADKQLFVSDHRKTHSIV